MNVEGMLAAIIPIVTALEQLGVAYYIGGSVVSSIYGIPRATFDVDLIADLHAEHVRPFVKQLEDDYYIDEDMKGGPSISHTCGSGLLNLQLLISLITPLKMRG